MRFSQDIDTSQHFVRGYGPGWIKINEQEIRRSLIVTPERLIVDWPPQAFADLEGAFRGDRPIGTRNRGAGNR